MILNDEYMQEFSPSVSYDCGDAVSFRHKKCGQESEETVSVLELLQWAEKHRYTCPEIEVESITVGGFEDGKWVRVTLLKDGRTRVEVVSGVPGSINIEQEISRKLSVFKEGNS